MISQFKDGLNSCGGLWDMIESHWEMFGPVMTSMQQDFQQLFTVCYSQSEGPLRAAEEATVRHWEAALEKVRGKKEGAETLGIGMTRVMRRVQSKCSLSDGQADFSSEDLLSFITGAGRLPLLGPSTLVSLRFYSQVGNWLRIFCY